MRILIVEDNEDLREIFRVAFSRAGHEPLIAADRNTAIETARAKCPNVLLLDIGLPRKEDGLEVCRLVRGEPWSANTKIIALSGWTEVADQEAALAAGCDHFVKKPATFVELEPLLCQPRGLAPLAREG